MRRRSERSSRQQTTLSSARARARVEALLLQYNGAGVLIGVGGCYDGGREEQAQRRPHGRGLWLPVAALLAALRLLCLLPRRRCRLGSLSCLRWLQLCLLLGYGSRPTCVALDRLLVESGASLVRDSKTRSVVGAICHVLWRIRVAELLLAACKTLVSQKPAAAKAAKASNPGTQCSGALALVVVWEHRYGLWRTQTASEPPPGRRAQQWPQSSLSCFELFSAPRGLRALGDARAAAHGPDGCKARARANADRERASAESPDAACSDGVKVPRHRRDVVPVIASARWRERVHVKRERTHT